MIPVVSKTQRSLLKGNCFTVVCAYTVLSVKGHHRNKCHDYKVIMTLVFVKILYQLITEVFGGRGKGGD